MILSFLLVILALLLIRDALMMRRLVTKLGYIGENQSCIYSADGFKVFVGTGKTISEQAVRTTFGYMKEHNLKLVCLIPENLNGTSRP